MNTSLRRCIISLLVSVLLGAWAIPVSAEEADPTATDSVTETTATDPVPDGDEQTAPTQDTDESNEDGTGDPTPTPEPEPTEPEPTEPEPTEPAPTPTEPSEPSGPRTLEGAVLRWGVNNESNNKAFAPGTYNFFSAGKLANPGAGGTMLSSGGQNWVNGKPAGWSAQSGNVSIEKWIDSSKSYQGATWEGLSTDATGATITQTHTEQFSGHQIVFSDGTGTYDPETESLSLSWQGDATIIYYSGMTFFYLSDPQLEVTGQTGTLTAELSGYATSMEDMTKWEEMPPQRVTVATFSHAEAPVDDVFTATPDYLGVNISDGYPAQTTSGDSWGSFPRDYIDFQQKAGAASYWFSSGGTADRFKIPLDLTVLLGEDATPPTPPTNTGGENQPTPVNQLLTPPPATQTSTTRTNTPTTTRSTASSAAPVGTLTAPTASASTTPVAYQSAGDNGWLLSQSPTSAQLIWWLVAVVLALAAAVTVSGTALYIRRINS